ncbi:uncharacterized protein LOC132257410 [Phlebotomus argentipes]|uniref:uncharacterized protein LOC132257410 n=1 Tax=Phlebotomus argentipes TaxID=94469 RepID=UPI002893266F|nr:uncharacterized protein LOC132257410 [Phlebotomus argentipes]
MKAFIVISLAVLATLASGGNVPGDGVIGSKQALRLSLQNPGDVYLVTNFMACLHAYSCMDTALSLEMDSPLGFLAQNVFIYEYDGYLVFFNQINAKLLFMLPAAKMKEVLTLVNVTADLNRLSLAVAFNSYLGINNAKQTKNCVEMFNYVGNVLAELIGVGCKPTAAVNLLGLLNLYTVFPNDLVVLQPYSPVKNLLVESASDLALLIARCSIVVDAAAFYNKNFLFQDIIFPGKTLSGNKIGNILGNKDILAKVPYLLKHILYNLPYHDVYEFLVNLLVTVTLDSKPLELYEDFFSLVALSGYKHKNDYETTTYYSTTEAETTTEYDWGK